MSQTPVKRKKKPLQIVAKGGAPNARENTGSMDALRKRIDAIDEKILLLLNERAAAAREIGHLKENLKLQFHSLEREKEIFKKLESENERLKGNFPTHAVHRIFREIMSASLALEKPLRIAFLGPKATFTHLACIEQFGLSAETVAVRSIPEIFDEVAHGRVDYGVVPIENSTEGMVNHTLDLFVDSKLKIIAEQALEVEHHLLARRKLPLASIQKVASHNHALAQCREWLSKHLSGVSFIETESTAQAAQLAADDDSIAAIASGFAADLYNLFILAERIQDRVDNFTRFLVLGHQETPPTGNDKTSILFSVKDAPGALYRMLKPFAQEGVNLTKIESRPRKTKPWEYVFFIDIDGHIQNPKVAQAVRELEEICIFLKILGSYPKAELARQREGAQRLSLRKDQSKK